MSRLSLSSSRHLLATAVLLWTAFSCVLVAGCSSKDGSSPGTPSESPTSKDKQNEPHTTAPATPATTYSYSMLAPGANSSTIIYARIVIDQPGQACPVLAGSDGSSMATQVRPMYPGQKTTSASFPVTVCEGVMTAGVAYHDASGTVSIAAVELSGAMVQIYGDSGCKPATCGTKPSIQFQALAEQGAKQPPDLILHMGDYNYRGTSGAITGDTYAYDAGDGGYGGKTCGLQDTYVSQNAQNSPKPDRWLNWQADFFMPAQNLLSKAPWVFARGNHELCSRAGPGWFYFMGPGSSLPGAGQLQMQCPAQGSFDNPPATAEPHIAMIPPYMVSLANLDIWVMDSANACDARATNALTGRYQAQYEKLASVAKNTTWVMSHRPIWGHQTRTSPAINKMLQTALKNTTSGQLPTTVQLSLAGHMHIFESLSFLQDPARPPQLIVGDSGVSLNSQPASGDFTVKELDGDDTAGNALQEFGFMNVTVGNGSWQGQLVGTTGQTLMNCDSGNIAKQQRICLIGK